MPVSTAMFTWRYQPLGTVTVLGVQPKRAPWTRIDQAPGGNAMRYLPFSSVVTVRVTPEREKSSVAPVSGAVQATPTWQTGLVGPRVTTP